MFKTARKKVLLIILSMSLMAYIPAYASETENNQTIVQEEQTIEGEGVEMSTVETEGNSALGNGIEQTAEDRIIESAVNDQEVTETEKEEKLLQEFVEQCRIIVKDVNDQFGLLNRKINSIRKRDKNTTKVVNRYKNSSTLKLRKAALKDLNKSKRYQEKVAAHINKSKDKALQGDRKAYAFAKKAMKYYGLANRVSLRAKTKKNKIIKVFRKTQTRSLEWKGPVLAKMKGTVRGPSGKETYYNMNMSWVIKNMRRNGYSAKKYPYWIRNDGCKMFGKYIMCAANLRYKKRGSIVESSLGTCIVVDTGGMGFHWLDIATCW